MKKGLLFGLLFFLTIVFAVAAGGCLHVHRWSEWTTVSEARCDKMGVLERVCAGCGAVEHDYSARIRRMGACAGQALYGGLLGTVFLRALRCAENEGTAAATARL